jgi:cell division protein FtsN
MSKDYKQSGKKPASSGKRSGGGSGGGSSVFAGLLIGLCLGVAIAVAAALYLNRAPNPFAGKVPTPTATAPAAQAKPPAVAAPLTGSATTPATAPNGQPAPANGERFDFYTMLPGLAEPKGATPAKPAEPAPSAAQPPKGVYLQAGAFQNETDADNLKAKLALMGVEASIQTTELPDKGVMHRVRVGPLAKAEDIDRVRAQLKVNGVDSAIVKN